MAHTSIYSAPLNGAPLNGEPLNCAPAHHLMAHSAPFNGAPFNSAPGNGAPFSGAPFFNGAPFVKNTLFDTVQCHLSKNVKKILFDTIQRQDPGAIGGPASSRNAPRRFRRQRAELLVVLGHQGDLTKHRERVSMTTTP